MNDRKLHELFAIYVKLLKAKIAANPERYPWATGTTTIHGNTGQTVLPARTPESFAAKLKHDVAAGNYTFSGNDTLKAACKELGVKPTQKALNQWLNA